LDIKRKIFSAVAGSQLNLKSVHRRKKKWPIYRSVLHERRKHEDEAGIFGMDGRGVGSGYDWCEQRLGVRV
jgi:hypothetical protein